MWWLTGYAFAFGTGSGFIGFKTDSDSYGDKPTAQWALGAESSDNLALWFFEYTFCAASAAIISGSVAEHITHHGFILYCVFFTGTCT
jgi:ammonia channel protein AmtB